MACIQMSKAKSVSTASTARSLGLESVCIRDLFSAPCFLYHRYEVYRGYIVFAFSVIMFSAPCFLYPRYEVYRGYIVFAFSVIMFVCLSVCL